MAEYPQKIPLTRETVAGWLESYFASPNPDFTLEEYLTQHVAGLSLEDDQVNTTNYDDLPDTTSVVEMIVRDIASYGYSN